MFKYSPHRKVRNFLRTLATGAASLGLVFGCLIYAQAQERYQKPPKEVEDVLLASVTPQAYVSPAGDYMLLADNVRYPPISVIARPMLRLAGLRIDPGNNGPHLVNYDTAFTLERISDGSRHALSVPDGAKLSVPVWSADGRRFAFTNAADDRVELWVGDTASGSVHRVGDLRVNSAFGQPIHWMSDNKTLLVQLVPQDRGEPPAALKVPLGPDVQESDGKGAPVWTYEDLLSTPHDEDLFDYYATAQLAIVDTDSGSAKNVGHPAIFERANPSPDGKLILVSRIHKPYSYLYTANDFAKDVEVWDLSGSVAYKLASLPVQNQVPIEGVPTGPRDFQWRPTAPSTLVWVEALDGGNTLKPAEVRDSVRMLKAPFNGQPAELTKTKERFNGIEWLDKGGLVFVSDYARKTRWRRTFLLDADDSSQQPRQIWSRNVNDRYGDPGRPVTKDVASGLAAIIVHGDDILLDGLGSSPQGDRPFLDRFNLRTLKAERLFHCDEHSYESIVDVLASDGSSFVTRRESQTDPPNYFVRAAGSERSKALTEFTDPAPLVRKIKKQLVSYQRPDGVKLSFTLYLPPDYTPGTKLPTLVWAYPLEYTDPSTAGQVSGSPNRFTTFFGPSELFFALHGYAVLDNAAMPVVGDPDTVNNTYVEQIVADAKAAIDKAAEMGVTDPDRVGVGGHSYGAFMTANLLAHSDLFRSGIARSGAYNRSLTPFGFQSERRTYWQATDLYLKMSPFTYADKIKAPLLMTHGEADNNSGTFPIQSDRMYQAIRGNGGTVRLVRLPDEAHGYSALESVETVLHEMMSWFDKYVKNAPPRHGGEAAAQK